MAASAEELTRLVAVAEGKLAALGKFPVSSGMAAWDAYRKAEQAMAAELVEEERASISRPGDAYRMMMGGISTTCTSGHVGLVKNWIGAARRRLEGGA